MARKPGTSLTREDVVATALDILRSEGEGGLGLHRIARELHIKPPSLYNHIDSQLDLERACAGHGWKLIARAMHRAADAEPDPRKRLMAIARGCREFVRQNQALYRVMSAASVDYDHPDIGPNLADAVNTLRQALEPLGITGDDAIHAVRMLRAMVHGFATLEIGGQFGMPQSVHESFDWMLDRMVQAL